ncbi:LysE family translocator [Vibrio ulleungensis]|uniref:LysE family translocator n=1 Tax=Vibrio ulleungensis TaxID=2807619 RepID=A0ABS2HLR6_9VIBR|nr:LysE family translocator [Vibrio ulleungensis]MBM7038420.1 LysE family translocator [Vibrio ulleungensis]
MELDLGLFVALVLLTLAPGADTALVLKQAFRHGLRAALYVSLGICSGLFIHALLVGIGVSALIMKSDIAFLVLKIAGASYLVYLGAKSIYAAVKYSDNSENVSDNTVPHSYNPSRAIGEGFLSNVLNPKTLAFYLAFLPQFIDAQGPVLAQAMSIAALHFVIAFTWQGFIAWISVKSASASPISSVGRWIEFGCGICLVFIGASIFIPFGSV